VADAKAAVSAECAKELAEAKAVRACLLPGCSASASALNRRHVLLLFRSNAVRGREGRALQDSSQNFAACSGQQQRQSLPRGSHGPLPPRHSFFPLPQKVDAELSRALATLEAEKAAAMKGLDAQVDKLSADILGRVLPEGVRV
jgi:hypothetical protein